MAISACVWRAVESLIYTLLNALRRWDRTREARPRTARHQRIWWLGKKRSDGWLDWVDVCVLALWIILLHSHIVVTEAVCRHDADRRSRGWSHYQVPLLQVHLCNSKKCVTPKNRDRWCPSPIRSPQMVNTRRTSRCPHLTCSLTSCSLGWQFPFLHSVGSHCPHIFWIIFPIRYLLRSRQAAICFEANRQWFLRAVPCITITENCVSCGVS